VIALVLVAPASVQADDAVPTAAQADAPTTAQADAPTTATDATTSNASDATAPAMTSDAPHVEVNTNAPSDMGDQGIAAMIGVAGGGRTTPGGLHIAGHFYYQLADRDWFDGSAAFTFGSSDAECFRDRMDDVICDHGLADGYAGTVTAGVRRFIPAAASGNYWPFVMAGVGAGIVRFPPEDDTTGVTFFVHGGAGMRVGVAEAIAITAQAQLLLGLGQFSHDVGWEPQFGVNFTAGAEFKL
jgi:hypothetical protein